VLGASPLGPLRWPAVRRLIVIVLLVIASVAACSTSGRELPAPKFTTVPSTQAQTVANQSQGAGNFALSSPDFTPGRALPASAGEISGNTSPALQWRSVPSNATVLAIVATNAAKTATYWIVTGIAPREATVPAGATPPNAVVLANSRGQSRWTGPSAGSGEKVQVVFTLYAFDHAIAVPTGSGSAKDLEVINASSFTKATLSGWFLGPGAAIDGG
jgi:phosphatidylethanolamine-binding protein (PEBP) family uncharacterized protein